MKSVVMLFLLLWLLYGVVEGSRVIRIHHAITHAAREGTRYAASRGAESPHPATAGEIEAYVRNAAGLGPSFKMVIQWLPNNQPGSSIEITTQYPYRMIFHLGPLGSFTLRGTSRMIIPRQTAGR